MGTVAVRVCLRVDERGGGQMGTMAVRGVWESG